MTSKILYWQAVAMSKAELFLFLKKQIETDNHEEEPFIMPFNRPKVNHTVPCDCTFKAKIPLNFFHIQCYCNRKKSMQVCFFTEPQFSLVWFLKFPYKELFVRNIICHYNIAFVTQMHLLFNCFLHKTIRTLAWRNTW